MVDAAAQGLLGLLFELDSEVKDLSAEVPLTSLLGLQTYKSRPPQVSPSPTTPLTPQPISLAGEPWP